MWLFFPIPLNCPHGHLCYPLSFVLTARFGCIKYCTQSTLVIISAEENSTSLLVQSKNPVLNITLKDFYYIVSPHYPLFKRVVCALVNKLENMTFINYNIKYISYYIHDPQHERYFADDPSIVLNARISFLFRHVVNELWRSPLRYYNYSPSRQRISSKLQWIYTYYQFYPMHSLLCSRTKIIQLRITAFL